MSTLTIAVLVLSACSGPGAAVVQRIRDSGSPLIEEVDCVPSAPVGQAEMVVVNLKRETTEALGIEFWCEVVKPAGGEEVNTSLSGGYVETFFAFTSHPRQPNIPDCSG